MELAAAAGLTADPWQENIIVGSMGVRADRKWSAFEVGVDVSRQNGKGSIGEIRALAGLYLIGERLITWTAHQFDTSLEAFRRLLELTEEADLQREIKRISRSHGEEGFELKSGQRIRFRTRTKGGGRGFSGDLLIYDEAMILPEATVGATFPTLSARPNPQVWYKGSAVDKLIHEHGVVFARVRARGHAGDDGLAWYEFSAPFDSPDDVPEEAAADPEVWAVANPSLGIRITAEYISKERRALGARTFAVERLGVGDWPDPDPDLGYGVIPPEKWQAGTDQASTAADPVCFAFDVTPNRAYAAISVAGVRDDGLFHVGVQEHKPGTDWVAPMIAELVGEYGAISVNCLGGTSAAQSLIPAIQALGIGVNAMNAADYVRACGVFFDLTDQEALKHRGTGELRAAVKGAVKREFENGWTWSRKSSAVDISPLVGCTLALGGLVDAGALGGGFEW